MRKLLMLGTVAMALVLPTASNAQVSLGLRLGFAPAAGDEVKDVKMSDGVKSQIPIQADALYKVTPEIAAGVYISYGIGQLNSDIKDVCDAYNVSCSASVLRVGVQGTYSFTKASQQFVPWAGVGIGYEQVTAKGAAGGSSVSITEKGFELLNLQVGGDYQVNKQLAVGPYLLLSVGEYTSIEGESITDKSIHEWFGFGVRGKFDL